MRLLRLAAAVLLLVLCSAGAHALTLGVNKASISFEDVLRGGYARDTITITTDSVEPIAGEVIVDPAYEGWLSFSARSFNFSRDAPYELHVEVRPPQDARVEAYRINMSILTGELARSSGGLMGTSTRASMSVPVLLSMTGSERAACRVGGARVLDTERGQPVEVSLSVINTGNVRIDPDVSVEIYDQVRSGSLGTESTTFGASILPTLTGTGSRLLPFDLERGQYWAVVRVPLCGFEEMHTFDVLGPGEIKDEGELLSIEAKAWSETGEIIPISAVFRNHGARTVRATLKGTITHIETGRIEKVIDSEEYLVDPGVTAELETFFNPQEPGQYMVTGKVFYNEKLTVEKSAVLNVNGSSLGGGGVSWNAVVLVVMAVIILVLIVLIARAKRRS